MISNTDDTPTVNDVTALQLSLPPTLLKETPHSSSDRAEKISFIVYDNAKLFPLQDDENENVSINSRVVSASVLGLQVTDLDHPVTIRLAHTQTVSSHVLYPIYTRVSCLCVLNSLLLTRRFVFTGILTRMVCTCTCT